MEADGFFFSTVANFFSKPAGVALRFGLLSWPKNCFTCRESRQVSFHQILTSAAAEQSAFCPPANSEKTVFFSSPLPGRTVTQRLWPRDFLHLESKDRNHLKTVPMLKKRPRYRFLAILRGCFSLPVGQKDGILQCPDRNRSPLKGRSDFLSA
jgi:hypothetical protein